MANRGKVYLVGAGPGDPGLITVKGAEILKLCDAVVYDRLVPLELVVTLPGRVQRHYVGKAADRHSLPQDEINELLANLAGQGLTVVRLKGGDPFMFARGGEEALHLKDKGIPFEIVPGVTAGTAAAGYAGIPLTHRKLATFAVFLTAHEAADKAEAQVPWEWLGQAKNGTIAGYMGVKQLPNVVKNLTGAGMDAEMPAAVIERGTTGIQKSVKGALKDLPELVKKSGIEPPALFIIGETVGLSDELGWFGGGALAGKRIMVTRPADQAGEMYALLRGAGAEVLPLPTIATSGSIDQGGWEALKGLFSGGEVLEDSEPWLVFTSENGVRYFMGQFFERGYDYRPLGRFKIAAMGSGTDRALKQHNLKADFIPSIYTSEVLAAELSDHLSDLKCRVVRVRGNLGDDRIERALESTGVEVTALQVYDTFTATWDQGMWMHFEENPPDLITFTSGSTVTGFVEILGAKKALEIAGKAVAASIGPMTTKIAIEAGITIAIEAGTHSVPGLVEAVISHFK
jgi:uroporphyrinogen III methyltransferase/synthase